MQHSSLWPKTRAIPGYLTITALVLLSLFCSFSQAGQAVSEKPRKVLALHSYHAGLSWTDSLVKGIDAGLAVSGVVLDTTHEFMDSKRIFSEEYLAQLVELYALKFPKNSFDVIIATDDLAFLFLRKHHAQLFPGKPVVFCGVNAFSDEMLQGYPTFTGVVEAFDIPATLNMALTLQPEANRVVVISDMTLTGRTNKKIFLEAIGKVVKPLDVLFLEDLTMDELRAEMGKLSLRDIPIWLSFTADRAGNYFSFGRSATLISEASKAPLYSLWDFHLGYGIAGGKLASGYFQGKKAAEMAAAILGGREVSSIPVVKDSPNEYMFDFQQLERFDFDTGRLPAGSVVINRPVTLYSQYKGMVWGTFAGFVTLALVILLLLFNMSNKRKANYLITRAKDRFQRIFDDAAVVLFEIDTRPLGAAFVTLQARGVNDFADYFTHTPEEMVNVVSRINVLDCNRSAVMLFGAASKEDLLSTVSEELKALVARVLPMIFTALKSGNVLYEWEATSQKLNGQPINILLSMRPGQCLDTSHTTIISAVDITERKKNLEELRQSENRFRTLFDSAASGIAIINFEGKYLRVNAALCNMFGYAKDELEKKSWQDMTHQDDLEKTSTMISDLRQGKTVHPLEKRYIHKDGRVVWGLLSVGVNIDQANAPFHYVAEVQDITWMKEVQLEMRLREERYRQIFEADLSGFFIASPSGKVLLCNQVFAAVLGYSDPVEVIGRNIADHFRQSQNYARIVGKLFAGKKVENTEVELVRSDGLSVTVLCNTIGRVNDLGQLVEVQGHIVDISRQKKLETQLSRAQKMEAIGLMAGGVAHDLNNILSGIINYPELMLTRLEPNRPLCKPLQSIKDSGQRAAAVVADLLTVARGAANVRENHDMNIMAREYIASPEGERLRTLYPDVTLHFESLLANAMISCSPVHIKKCLMNLVTNGMESIVGSGEVRLAIKELSEQVGKEGEEAEGKFVVLEVSDTGLGIAEKDKDHIFEPFYTKKVMGKSGTGLGLAVVWNTVQDHGGRIQVTSNDQGTTFRLIFPQLEVAPVDFAKDQDATAVMGNGEHVLVVDDEAVQRDIAGQMLTVLGYRVDAVASGEVAIAFLKNQKTDLVLLDMFMEPGINGCQAYEEILTEHPEQKAIIASGYSKSDDVKRAISLGVGNFIEKPYSLLQLGRIVHRELHKAR